MGHWNILFKPHVSHPLSPSSHFHSQISATALRIYSNSLTAFLKHIRLDHTKQSHLCSKNVTIWYGASICSGIRPYFFIENKHTISFWKLTEPLL
jgi:hypothetical protein